jgi:hypothetical protein
MPRINKRVRGQRMTMVRRRYNGKNKALLRALPFTNIFQGDLTTPRTLCLTNDSELALTLSDNLPCFLVPLDILWQTTIIPRLYSMVDTREGGHTASLLRISDDDIKALRKGIGNQTIATLVDRCKDLACPRRIGRARRIGVDGPLN